MNEKIEKRYYFDVLKGIAIFLVVVGHSMSGLIHEYAYAYHLALFFFITGFLYNENKYGLNPALNIGNKIKNNWGKFVVYTSLIGLLHFVANIGPSFSYLFGGIDGWDFFSYRNYLLNSIVMNNTEALCGAMWFVAPLILVSGILGLVVYWGNKVYSVTRIKWTKHVVILFATMICLLLGNERMEMKFQLELRLDVALFVLPLLVMAYYIKTYIRDFEKYLKWYFAVPCFILTIFMCIKGIQNVLAGQFVQVGTFYVYSVIGIYQSMYLAKVICMIKAKIAIVSVFFNFIGRYTFEIMAFHFVVFKMIDYLWYIIMKEDDITALIAFPHTYNVWIIYISLGCLVPAWIKMGIDKIFKRVKNIL